MSKFGEVIDNVCKIFCFISIVIMVASIGAQVFCWYFLNSPLSWPEEISMTAFCGLGFAGTAMVAERNGHLRIDILPVLFPKAKFLMDFGALAVNMLYMFFLSYLCWDMTVKTQLLGQELLAVPLPVWIIWAYMCVMVFLAAIQTFLSLCRMFSGEKEK